MKKIFWIVSVALLAFTACRREEAPDNDPAGIAMIVKNGQIDYFRQIETSFRGICQEKGLEAYYYSTSSETDYQEQLAAVTELRKLGKSALKGIIFTPSYGINGENAEAEVAALAQERGIPVIILDSPVRTNGPLASAPYIGTDNIAAGKVMAQKVTAEKVAVFAAINSPGIERATAFKELKPEAEVFRVGENSSKDVLAAMDKFDDFVFFNGNSLVGSLAMLLAAGKHVYTFDVYAEFLDVLMTGSPSLKGVMAQNTFAMARKAVETVLADSGRQGEMVPTFYITTSNLDADEVQPFLEFYGRQVTPFNLAEKIIGKWMAADINGQPALTNEKMVLAFLSSTKGYISASLSIHSDADMWSSQLETDVAISGNIVTVTFHPDEHNTSVHELNITAINDSEFTANQKVTVTIDGNVVISEEKAFRFTKLTANYSAAILGLWECHGITGGETNNDDNARLEFLADGTYRFYRRSDAGIWSLVPRQRNEYFVDGNLLCTRWQAEGEQMSYEWWEIASAADGRMQWTALRQQADGTTFQQGVTWTATEARTVLASMDFKGHPFYGDLTYSYAYDDDCRLVKMKKEQVGTGLVITEFDYTYTPGHITKQGREEAYTVTEECSLDDHGRIVELVHNSINDETQKEYHYTYTYTYDEDGHLTTVSQWIEGKPNALITTFAWQDGELRSKTTDQSSVLMVCGYEPGDAPAQALFSRNGYSEADELCPQGCFGTLPLHLPAKQTVTLTLNGVEMSKRTTEYTYTVTAGRLASASDTSNYFLHWEMR